MKHRYIVPRILTALAVVALALAFLFWLLQIWTGIGAYGETGAVAVVFAATCGLGAIFTAIWWAT